MSTTATAPRERPILFRDEMVRAILAGEKTQTRRPVKPMWGAAHAQDWSHDGTAFEYADNDGHHRCDPPRCLYGATGDRLYVRERFAVQPCECCVWYRATADLVQVASETRWKPGIHMFRRHARIFLEVVSVRVERVQAITEADARAEGMATLPDRPGATLRDRFAAGWDTMYAGGDFAWAKNPWVWVVEFRRVAP